MRRECTRGGFTILELLAVVGSVGIGTSFVTVAMNAGAQSTPAGVRQPDEAQKKEIEKIRKELDEMKKKIGQIEGQLDTLEKREGKNGEKQGEKDKGLLGARAAARQMKDATQVRGIGQSFMVWANQNQGVYPLPSKIDLLGTTVAGEAAQKDTTANILSMLIFSGHISTELCISPAEANASIMVNKNYTLDRPATAAKPADALWDPSFSADFTNGKTGNVSYGHLQPAGKRLSKWADTFVSTEAVIGNRGPEIESVTNDGAGGQVAKTKLASSVTFLIHGERNSWEGNVGYNDGHVQYEVTLAGAVADSPDAPVMKRKDGTRVRDCLFFDEADDQNATGNLYLGIFTKSGKTVADWTAIWD